MHRMLPEAAVNPFKLKINCEMKINSLLEFKLLANLSRLSLMGVLLADVEHLFYFLLPTG